MNQQRRTNFLNIKYDFKKNVTKSTQKHSSKNPCICRQFLTQKFLQMLEAYSEPCQTSKRKVTIFAKRAKETIKRLLIQ